VESQAYRGLQQHSIIIPDGATFGDGTILPTGVVLLVCFSSTSSSRFAHGSPESSQRPVPDQMTLRAMYSLVMNTTSIYHCRSKRLLFFLGS